ncbi:MAG: amidophosphoribosyltransferase [Bacteroidales bacterium]|jgi:amidophosphoribosyltransferase
METLKHECGIAIIRLKKPAGYYQNKYGSRTYGLQKLFLLMEKQHNRGQEGAGLACINTKAVPGEEYIFRDRKTGNNAINEVFDSVYGMINGTRSENTPFIGDMYMGHLRYSTTGKSGLSYIHPHLRRSNWAAKTLVLCGNFNLTNIPVICKSLTDAGQHPRSMADTHILLEQMGHRLDMEIEYLYREFHGQGYRGTELTGKIEDHFNATELLKKCTALWDGGYVVAGMTGSGETFCVRDPWGIRTAFYYQDPEIAVVASERPVIQTVMNVDMEDIRELLPGQALRISRDGNVSCPQILDPRNVKPCSFERIYFSRGSDADIYRERKALGNNLVKPVLEAVDHDFRNTVFSYIPNTAEAAYYGLLQGLEEHLNGIKKEAILSDSICNDREQLGKILSLSVRNEKVAVKDIKLRTFIAEGNTRDDLAAHVYDVTYGTIVPEKDNLVVLDDSIVRGTTLKQSILKILDRLHPKKIVIVSSSPQIRYPDFYGIDMSGLGQFIAFRAAMQLLQERGMEDLIQTVYRKAKRDPRNSSVNHVHELYAPFTAADISYKISQMLTPAGTGAQVQIVYQSLEGLHKACPGHTGDWYFSGNYPTPGGVKLVNRAFVEYMESVGN